MMKIRYSINSIKVLCLATVAIAIANNTPPSLAEEPTPTNPGVQRISPVPEPGSVVFFNRGQYTARYFLSYTFGRKTQTLDSGNIPNGKQVVFSMPAQARDIRVEAKYFDPSGAKTLFVNNLTDPTVNICFTTSGTLLMPTFDRSCGGLPTVPIVRGNLIQNGNFTSDLANWTANNTVVSSFPTAQNIKVAIIRVGNAQLRQDFSTTAGAKYRVSFDVARQFSADRSQYQIFTNNRLSKVLHKLSDLSSTPMGDFDRYSFEVNTSTSSQDTLNFINTSNSARFMITNVVIEQITPSR